MTVWRATTGAFLILLVGLPLFMPFGELLLHPAAWQAWAESERLLLVARNSLLLVAGTLAAALPLGVGAAVLFYRTNLPLCGLWRFLTLLTLFVPLALFASGWQAALGAGGWLPLGAWTGTAPNDPDFSSTGMAWKPWGQGLGTAIWVHAMAGLPWVVILVGQGLRWVEPELEEDGLLSAGPARVLRMVTLPRSRAALAAAALWVALQTATEITVTDMMQVRTFAEEVYNQFVRPEPGTVGGDLGDLVAGAVAVAAPAIVLTWLLVLWAVRSWERDLPPLSRLEAAPRPFPLGWLRWPCLAIVLAAVGLLLGVPVISLVWKAGLGGLGDAPRAWSSSTTGQHLAKVLQVRWKLVGESLLLAGLAGMLAAGFGLVLCWLALGKRWWEAAALALLAAAWALPAPVLGIGLKEAIACIRDWSHSRAVAVALYYGPSPLPIVWAYFARFLPCAVAVLWPVIRLFPSELQDAARVEGARPWQSLWYIMVPLFAGVGSRAALAVSTLALGELGASKLASTPGSETFTQVIFVEMHYGVTNDLAALCLILLTVIALGGALVSVTGWLLRRWGHVFNVPTEVWTR